MPKDRQFSRIDWGAIGESFRQSQSIRRHNEQNLDRDLSVGAVHTVHEYEEDTSEKSSRPRCLLCALLLVVVGVAAAVCFVTIPPDTAISYWKAVSGSGSSNKKQAVIDVVAQQGQEMLERAEQITAACGNSSPLRRSISSDSTGTAGTGTPSCQKLCQHHMCCVVQDEEYSCENDVKKECAVYAGCEALIKDSLWR